METLKTVIMTASLLDITYVISTLILVAALFEKVFNIEFIGRRVFRLLWSLVKFFAKWILAPIIPGYKKVKPTLDLLSTFAKNAPQVEKQLSELLTVKEERTQQINQILDSNKNQDETLSKMESFLETISKELNFNGGGSVKDTVGSIQKSLTELNKANELVRIHLDIEDKLSDRMVFKVNEYGACTFISNSFLNLFGWTEQDMLGDNWLFCIDSKDAETVERKWTHAIKNKTRYYNKQRIKDSHGEAHICIVIAYPVIMENQLTGFRGIVRLSKSDELSWKDLPPIR